MPQQKTLKWGFWLIFDRKNLSPAKLLFAYIVPKNIYQERLVQIYISKNKTVAKDGHNV